MKLAIMQPYFFPYIGYFQLINAVDKFILYENLNFRKETWMTRNRILACRSNPFFVHIPVKSKSSNKKISEVRIAENHRWRKTIKDSIYFNYKNSKYYHEIIPFLEKVINYETDNLHSYNSFAICKVCELLGIETKIEYGNSHYLNLETALELKYPAHDNRVQVKKKQRKTDRIFLISKQEEANIFINPIGGAALYSKAEFGQNGIELLFLKTKSHSYPQNSHSFYPDLSIIDVLLNCGIEKTKELLTQIEFE